MVTLGEKTLDLSDLGVNLTSTFEQLVTPEGIVDQYAVVIAIQIIYILGYLVSGSNYLTQLKSESFIFLQVYSLCF